MSRTLVLVRHGQSEWNLKNLFTGWRDVGLTELGYEEAKTAGSRLAARGLKFDIAFTSALKRAQKTGDHILSEVGQAGLETIRDQALNERDYGELSGLNKDDARKKWGEEQVHVWRRSYATPPPGGESLRDTGARVWPYYIHTIQPHVLRGGCQRRKCRIAGICGERSRATRRAGVSCPASPWTQPSNRRSAGRRPARRWRAPS